MSLQVQGVFFCPKRRLSACLAGGQLAAWLLASGEMRVLGAQSMPHRFTAVCAPATGHVMLCSVLQGWTSDALSS
jgi:hypothetical protein